MLKVNELFVSLQGEGRFQGQPVIFVRLSGCTRKCDFCDTSYHNEYTEMTVEEVINEVRKYVGVDKVVFTGGEPLIQLDEIERVKEELVYEYDFHLETNGDLIQDMYQWYRVCDIFEYICVSPKELKVAERIQSIVETATHLHLNFSHDIKVVTDLEGVGVNMIKYATMLMPLTTYNEKIDIEIKKRVWQYCMNERKAYSARLHTMFGKRKGI
jgi:organic radical activating enzyme